MTHSARDGGAATLPAAAPPELFSTEPAGQSEIVGTVLLTVLVPVYNEAATIDALLRRVLAAPYRKQVVVVDDGSRDDTQSVLQRWEGRANFVFLRHAVNRGKGAAIRTGLDRARGKFTLIQDADLEYDPGEYPRMLEPLVAGQADVVYGSRYLDMQAPGRAPWTLNRVGVVGLNLWLRLLYGVRLTDEATCYKAFPTEVLRRMDLACERFEFCPEVTAKASRLGLRIHEVPISYRPRGLKEGKKIRWRDGWVAAATLWKYRRWSPRPR
jgi:glycosyltransferase involved in cell wall biosynthesis